MHTCQKLYLISLINETSNMLQLDQRIDTHAGNQEY